jgi:hypothetical protein
MTFAELMEAANASKAGATHEGFWSRSQVPESNLTAIQSLVFQAENVSPASGFSRNRTFVVSCVAPGMPPCPICVRATHW